MEEIIERAACNMAAKFYRQKQVSVPAREYAKQFLYHTFYLFPKSILRLIFVPFYYII